jgi:hypothetical protein
MTDDTDPDDEEAEDADEGAREWAERMGDAYRETVGSDQRVARSSRSIDEDVETATDVESGAGLGGGPRRVVSDESVDDVLDTIREGPDGDGQPTEPSTEPADSGPAGESVGWRDDGEAASEADESVPQPEPTVSPGSDPAAAVRRVEPAAAPTEAPSVTPGDDPRAAVGPRPDAASESTSEDGAEQGPAVGEESGRAVEEAAAALGTTTDASASDVPATEDPPLNGESMESVGPPQTENSPKTEESPQTVDSQRTAEPLATDDAGASGDPEPSPSIDEVDLSVDDLDDATVPSRTPETSEGTPAAEADRDGPLAGQGVPETGEEHGAERGDSETGTAPGVLGRVRRWFAGLLGR